MLAIIEGVSSARHLARLVERDLAYMWICGGVGVNYHLISDFRKDHPELLDQILTDTVATLMHQDLVTLEVVAQDGMRVRANAGSSSFRRRKTLEKCREEAKARVKQLRDESDDHGHPNSSESRRTAARKRAAEERDERVNKALEELAQLETQREQREKGSGAEARISTTDPEARRMKTADGGTRPCYNFQFATDGKSRIIVNADVTNSGSDRGEMAPMHEKVMQRYDKVPENYLVDCGFASKNDITCLEQRGSKVYAPIYREEQMRKRGTDPHARQATDSDEMFAFRQRMETAEAKELYKQRPSIAEFPNAVCRNCGLQQLKVRGLAKAKTMALWYAITFNFLRMKTIGCFT
jgi:hypothetical protein